MNACEACEDELNDAAKCRRCVALRADCADCCLTENSNDEKVVRCTKEDNDNDYDCTALFYDDDCEQVECGDTCFNACNDYSYSQFSDDDIETPNACYGATGTGGTPKNTTPKGWQRRGCPEENDDELAPDGSCSLLPGTGLDRKWKCSSGELEPQFSGCDPNADSGLKKPAPYYVVTKAVPDCAPSCETSPCSLPCGSAPGCAVYGTCTPPCTPSCTSSCTPSCFSGDCDEAESSCSANCSPSCNTTSSCTPSCEIESSRCTPNSCNTGCTSACIPDAVFYIYALSSDFKKYIEDCIEYSDEYEKCKDRAHCCEEAVCQSKVVKDQDGKNWCNAGKDNNCENCDKRICYADDCKEFDETTSAKSCPQMSSDANGCLLTNKDCFKEIGLDTDEDNDEGFFYPYVARSGDALHIIWQIVTNHPKKKVVDGLSLYTLVKVWQLNEKGLPIDVVHTSMMNVKSPEAAFSIYGTTTVSKGVLLPGVSYQARVYYFLPPPTFCKVECECEAGDTDCMSQACQDNNKEEFKIELEYVSLILQRIRE